MTFNRLLEPRRLPADFAGAVQRISYDSASLKINVALSELPDFLACPGTAPGPHHRGTIHICPDQDYIERAYDDAKYGKPSTQPVLECTIPSVVDPTVAPPGKHLMSMFIQYAPYKLRGATWDDLREDFADRCFDLLNDYAPNFKRSVLATIPAFDGFHRFMPILAQGGGALTKEVGVSHRPRIAGRSKYGVWNRLGRGIRDLAGLRWYLKRQLKSAIPVERPPEDEPSAPKRPVSRP